MIYKFKDHKEGSYFLEFFITEKKDVAFQVTDAEQSTIDIRLNKQQVSDMIGCLLTLQNKLKQNG